MVNVEDCCEGWGRGNIQQGHNQDKGQGLTHQTTPLPHPQVRYCIIPIGYNRLIVHKSNIVEIIKSFLYDCTDVSRQDRED